MIKDIDLIILMISLIKERGIIMDRKADKHLILFFVITLAWTWSLGFSPVITGIEGTPRGLFSFYFGGGAPSVTALFLVFLTYTKQMKRDYFKRCFSFRYMGAKWLLLSIAFFLTIYRFGNWRRVFEI